LAKLAERAAVGGSQGLVGGSIALAIGAFAAGALVVSLLLRHGGEQSRGRASPEPEADEPSARRLAAELSSTREEAAATVAELDSLYYSISHDLRSPIGAILNFTAVLVEDHERALDDDARAILARIRRSAEAALAQLEGLLRLSRVSRQELHPVPVDVEAMVREVVRTITRSGCSVELELGPLPTARADAALLRVVFLELLENAVKFSAGSEKPRIRVDGRLTPDGSRLYGVADEGVGFDPRYAGRLFGIFERLHSRDQFPGAGVGLAVVRRIVERHGGRVFANAEPGHGARFEFSLPDPSREGDA
jgi:signal transduction histidine kinase